MIRQYARLLGVYEVTLEKTLIEKLSASSASVTDVSGGCGASYHVKVTSKKFLNLSRIQQHRLVQSVLEDELKKWHAVKIETSSD